jgi:hypothetical protein
VLFLRDRLFGARQEEFVVIRQRATMPTTAVLDLATEQVSPIIHTQKEPIHFIYYLMHFGIFILAASGAPAVAIYSTVIQKAILLMPEILDFF